jgi:hypothetical protein
VADDFFDQIAERSPMAPGPTGALFERVRLADGSSYVVKHLSRSNDAIVRTLRDRGSIKALWDNAVFSRLPAPLTSSIVALQEEDDGWAVMMPDLTEHLIPPDRILSGEDSRRVLAAVDAMHETFAGERIDGLCSHRDKLELNSPRMVEAERWADDDYPPERGRDGREWPFTQAVTHGWELFTQLAPGDVGAAIASLQLDPDPLAHEMDRFRSTMIPGDLQFSNMALVGDAICLLDWGSAATRGTAEEDFAWYLMANQPRIDQTHDEIMSDFVELRGSRFVSEAFDLSCIFIVALMGCWRAWFVMEEPDDMEREAASSNFEWWMNRTRAALTTWSPP